MSAESQWVQPFSYAASRIYTGEVNKRLYFVRMELALKRSSSESTAP